jgi:hypothetical protein
VEVRAVGPGDRPVLGGLLVPVAKAPGRGGREHAAPVTQIGQVGVTGQAVGERQPEPVVAQDLDVGNVAWRREHGLIVGERRNRRGELMCCHELPVGEQLALVECGPLEDLPPARVVRAFRPGRRGGRCRWIPAACCNRREDAGVGDRRSTR